MSASRAARGGPGVVVVTGASAGIGRACADLLHARGWTVVGASRRGSAPPGCDGLVMDVDDDTSVEAGVEEVRRRHGRVDAVVAAAGWGLAGAVEQTTVEEAKAQIETNFWGVVRVARAALPLMRAQSGGRLVLVSSIGGVVALPFQAYYSASKFALEGWAEALAYEVAPFGVEVTLVQPGNVRTDFTASRRTAATATSDDAYRRAFDKAIGTMAHDEADGVAADVVARSVARVLGSRHPRRRVSVGKAGERVGVVAKRVLPYRLFSAAAKGALGVD